VIKIVEVSVEYTEYDWDEDCRMAKQRKEYWLKTHLFCIRCGKANGVYKQRYDPDIDEGTTHYCTHCSTGWQMNPVYKIGLQEQVLRQLIEARIDDERLQ
jgi:hypothetical protein